MPGGEVLIAASLSAEPLEKNVMPHVIVKAWPGKTEDQKRRLAEAITRDVMDILGYGAESVSVAFQDIPSDRWKQEVYGPDIEGRTATLYKKPGYKM
ncbi:4-oxalocrotonate tautomerase [Caballeronia calidae]|uniref:4-oxalocrotonate tautomerase n=1 Tax=Caballeronia calidae TaxID=1777139 RepID=A0A158D527_9BURK|nr:tautomerase family protein [Caballeronia calidae]SAK89688.1 4-oxalocrotonate tautomerase [Caballeronia calidae]